MERLSIDYGNKTKLNFAVRASRRDASVFETFNTVLATYAMLEHSDCVFMVDNTAVYDMCQLNLGIQRPTYTNLNRLIAQFISSITASDWFSSLLKVDLTELKYTLVANHCLCFHVVSYTLATSARKSPFEQFSIPQITNACFEIANQMVKCDRRHGKYMAWCMLYRGTSYPGTSTLP